MEIFVESEFNIIKPFEIHDLPDLVVITGENGSGKSQLLSLLSLNTSLAIFDPITGEHKGDRFRLTSNGNSLQNIILVSANEHDFQLGGSYQESDIMNRWGNLPHIYLSYLNCIRIKGEENVGHKELNEQFLVDTRQHNSNNFEKNSERVSQNDFLAVKTIFKKKKDPYLVPSVDECIIYLDQVYSGIFHANLTFLYLQYQKRVQLGMDPGEAPWVVFNRAMEEAEISYRLEAPSNGNTKIYFSKPGNPVSISADKLSSGEKTLMILVLAIYNSRTSQPFPEVILFDEPDAYLHPSMARQMLNIFKTSFIKEKKVKVIITTHSPSTVAVAPELSIFTMSSRTGKLKKSTKSDAIRALTVGLKTLAVNYEHRKQVFVESPFDELFYSSIFSILSSMGMFKEFMPHFLSVGTDDNFESPEKGKGSKGSEGNGCERVKRIVNQLNKNGNTTVFGIVDHDGKNSGNENILVLGDKKRYSVENYIFDPIFLLPFIAYENGTSFETVFKQKKTLRNFIEIDNDELIALSNKFFAHLVSHNLLLEKPLDMSNSDPVRYKLYNKFELEAPNWFFNSRGHDLESLIIHSFPFLKNPTYSPKGDKSTLKRLILEGAINNLNEMIPNDIIGTFEALENKRITQ